MAGIFLLLITPGEEARADDTNLFGTSPGTFIPFVTAIDSPASGLPKVKLTFGDGVAHEVTMDTGSVGLVVSRDVYNPSGPGLKSGNIVYNSSGIVENGTYYQTTFSFLGADGRSVATTSLPVLVVDNVTCLLNARNCTPSSSVSGVSQMGVGFGQEAASQPNGIPSNNPFLNITQTVSGVMPSKGYMIDRTGVTLGLQASTLNGFSLVKLAPYPQYSTATLPEWLLAPANVTVNGTAANGVILSDTGVTGMYLTAPSGSSVATFKSSSLECGSSCAAPGTTVTVSIPGQAGQVAGYSFTVGPDGGKQAGNAMSPVFVSVDGTAASAYVNTTLNLFNNFDYLYDEAGGFVGFRQRSASAFGATSVGVTLQGPVSLPANFVSTLPTYLMDYQQLMTATTDGRTFLQQYGVPVQLIANGNATFNNVLSGPGALGVASGTVTLAAANTYTGATTVASGAALALSGAGSVARSSGLVASGTFDVSGTTAGATVTSLSGGGQVRLGGKVLSVTQGGSFAGSLVDGGLSGGQNGSLAVTGGTLLLSGVNTYGGLTTIASGATLALTGAGSVSSSSGVVADGVLDVSGVVGTRIAALSGGGTVRLGSQTLYLTGGAGQFTGNFADGGQAGGTGGAIAVMAGTLVLSGVNTHTGTTTVSAGATLALSGNASAAQAQLSLAQGGTLDVSGSSGAAVAGLSGAGAVRLGGQSLTLAGTGSSFAGSITDGGLAGGTGGTLIVASGTHLLTGVNSHTGGTVVRTGGTLAVTTDAALGAPGAGLVLDGGTLQAASGLATTRPLAATANGATLDGTVGGITLSGTLNAAGALSTLGPVGFNGAGVVAGTVTLGGLTSVNGALAATSVVVQRGATLRGTGQVYAPVTVLGTLAPGNSPGTLAIAGPVVLAPSSVSQFDIDGTGTGAGAGNYSRVVVTGGGLALGGTVLPALRGITGAATNDFTPSLGQQFMVATAAGGISGSFAGVVQPAGLAQGTRLDVQYGSTTVSLVATPTSYGNLAAAGLTQTASQASLGTALDAIRPAAGARPAGPLATVLGALYPLPGTAIPSALDGLGAKIYGDALFAGLEQQRLVAGAVADQLATLRGATPSTRAQVASASWGGTVWVRSLGAWTDLVHDQRARGAGATLSGVAAGTDVRLPGDVLAGLAIAYTGATISADDGGRDSAQALHVAGYGGWQAGALFVNTMAGGTWTEDQFRRMPSLLAAAATATARSQSGSDGVFGRAEAGVLIPLGNVRVTPSVALAGQTLGRNRTTEAVENSAGLSVASGTVRSLRSEVGARMEALLTVAGQKVRPALSVEWSHEFGDTSTAATASFLNLGGPAFATSTASFGRNGLTGGAGITATIAPRVTVFAAYDADVRTRYTVQAVTGGLQVSW